MATISFENATKVFPDGTVAVDALNLDIADGEFAVIVGPSGSGKSTAMRMVAGLEGVTSGTLRIGDQIVNDVQPRKRDVAMVFQNYALYPHKSVADNLAFALKMRGVSKAERQRRAADAARRLGIEDLLHRRPSQLSGGQRQRVALGRAIVRAPQAFLMDEPLSNLDAKLRVDMRAYLTELHRELATTTLYVTHDQTEALTMGDRVAVMRDGRLEQSAAPQELYDRPANLFVAGFIGSPAMSVVPALLEADGDGLTVRLEDQRLTLPAGAVPRWPGLADRVGSEVLFGVRPEALSLAGDGAPPGQVLHLTPARTEMLGSDVLVHCDVGALDAPSMPRREAAEGPLLPVTLDGEVTAGNGAVVRIAARLPSGTPVTLGERVPLAVDLHRIHFFDPGTHDAIAVDVAADSSPLARTG